MGKITVTIERGQDHYAAWANEIPGIYAAGETIDAVKNDVQNAIRIYKKNNSNIPEELKGNIDIKWNFDVESFMEYISGTFSKRALSRMTGINEKQLGHYASGLKKPRPATVEKIENALRQFVNDMSQVHLV
jgi:predicted RNase H-like HicB family nuclease